jgi:hypothetical protein
MVRTEFKISMKKKCSACLYFKLSGKNIRSASGFFVADIPFLKKPMVTVLALI